MPELALIRNNAPGATVFEDPESGSPIVWEGANDPSGGDLQYVSEDLLTHPRFRTVLDRGVLVVEEVSDATREKLERQNAAWRERQEARQAAIDATVEREADKDFVSIGCVGPNPRGTGRCDIAVPVRSSANKTDHPPLCEQHAHLAREYVMVQRPEQTEADGITPVTDWVRATLGQPLPSQSA